MYTVQPSQLTLLNMVTTYVYQYFLLFGRQRGIGLVPKNLFFLFLIEKKEDGSARNDKSKV